MLGFLHAKHHASHSRASARGSGSGDGSGRRPGPGPRGPGAAGKVVFGDVETSFKLHPLTDLS